MSLVWFTERAGGTASGGFPRRNTHAGWVGAALALVLATPLRAASDEQIARFWQSTRERLAREPMEAQVERTPDRIPYQKFRVTLRSLGGIRFRAWLSVPIQGESAPRAFPAVITGPGYGGYQQGIMLDDCMRGYVILQVFPRSQGESEELWKIDGPEKLTWHLERPEGYYYQGAYADMMRGVDFLASRAEVDPKRIAVIGTSQGGGLALALAALDPRIQAVCAHLPFLCDIRRAVKIPGSLVNRLLTGAGAGEEALETLDYFDPLRLAPKIAVPALLSAGGKDTTCPAATIRAVFDQIRGIKSLVYYPELSHTTARAYYDQCWAWIGEYLGR